MKKANRLLLSILAALFLLAFVSCKNTTKDTKDETPPAMKIYKLENVKGELVVTPVQDDDTLYIKGSDNFWIFINAEDDGGVGYLTTQYTVNCETGAGVTPIHVRPAVPNNGGEVNGVVPAVRVATINVIGTELHSAMADCPAGTSRKRSYIGATANNYGNVNLTVKVFLVPAS